MSEKLLQGRRALVTGSVQGIGLAIAQELARQGCAIVLHGLAKPEQMNEARSSVLAAGAPAVEVHGHDLRDAAQVAALMETVLSSPLDILVNNAGIQVTAPLAEMPRSTWDAILAVNLSAAFDAMRLALPAMARQGYGRVINIASVHGLVASVHKAPYVAAKFGLVGLSRVAALEYASAGTRESGGVTVNCICPGGPRRRSSSRRSKPGHRSAMSAGRRPFATCSGRSSRACGLHCRPRSRGWSPGCATRWRTT